MTKLTLFSSCVTNPNARATKSIATVAGTAYVTTYKPVIDKDGRHQIVEDNKKNAYEEIQSFRAGTDLHAMIKRYKQGDVNALNNVTGIFGDFSNAPKTLADYFEMQSNAQNTFLKLPTELREEFNNNPLEFLTLYGTTEFTKRVANYNGKQTRPDKVATVPPVVDVKDGVDNE